jgi:hypothetical protein
MVFGKPKKESKDGYWYSILGFDYGFFVPCRTDVKNTDTDIPIQLQYAKEMNRNPNPIEDYRSVKKYTKILIDLIIWGLRSNGIVNLSDFLKNFNKFVEIDNFTNSNSLPTVMYRKLPDKANFSYLVNLWPEYFTSTNKVRLNESLYEKLKVYLKRYYTETDGLSLEPNPYLSNIFEYEWDFKSYKFNKVLIGDTHLDQWINNKLQISDNGVRVHSQIEPNDVMDSKIPILYNDIVNSVKRMYLVQSVEDGVFENALQCGYNWITKKLNTGYETKFSLNLSIPHVIYDITKSYSIFISSEENDNRDGSESYVSLVRNGNFYAALLELY